jgi:U3 small nucleolar RNA-associated protein 22
LQSLFQEKDYLDARFFHKRSYYLAVLAQSISTSFQVDVFYGAALSDPRQTVLVLRPRKGEHSVVRFFTTYQRNSGSSHDFSRTHTEVRIIPALSSTHPIPLHRLSPSHSGVRVRPTLGALFSSTNPSTPIYNTAILLSTFPKLSLLSTNALIQSSQAFRDAHTLLRVWANQRGYGEGTLCIHGFEGKGPWWASVLGFLLDGEEPVSVLGKGMAGRRRFVGKGLSSYQLFRASLDLLGKILVLASYIRPYVGVSAKQEFENAPAFVKSTNGHKVSENLILDALLILFI